MRALFTMGLFVLAMGSMAMTCAPKPDTGTGGSCKHPENVFTPAVDGNVDYIGDDGKTHHCSGGGHCKGKTYNACSASKELCCTKE